MILNGFSITELFMSAVSLILVSWAGIWAAILAGRWKHSHNMAERSRIEEGSHLVLLITAVVLGIRLLSWPFFYATLQSFISDIDGAMCIFGVTQVKRLLTGVSELFKPVSFFLVGAWLLLHLLDRSSRTSALMGTKLSFLGVVAIAVAVDCVLDIVLMLRIAPGTLVSCCTTVTDVLDRPSRLLPRSVLGPGYERILEYGYFASNVLMVLGLGLCRAFVIKPAQDRSWRRPLLGLVFLYALLNAGIFILAQIEVHAPRIMNLPFHHCIYCLWQYVPDTVLMYAFLVVGTCAAGWAFLLDLLGRTTETGNVLRMYLSKLYGLSMFCYAASLIMNTVHVVAA